MIKNVEIKNIRVQDTFSLNILESASVIYIKGHNGQGKSSIGDAIAFALTGCDKEGNTLPLHMIKYGETKMSVELDLGGLFLKRSLTDKKNMTLKTKIENLGEVAITQTDLQKIIGSKDAVLSCCFAGYFMSLSDNKKAAVLEELTPKIDKEQVLESILGMKIPEHYKKQIDLTKRSDLIQQNLAKNRLELQSKADQFLGEISIYNQIINEIPPTLTEEDWLIPSLDEIERNTLVWGSYDAYLYLLEDYNKHIANFENDLRIYEENITNMEKKGEDAILNLTNRKQKLLDEYTEMQKNTEKKFDEQVDKLYDINEALRLDRFKLPKDMQVLRETIKQKTELIKELENTKIEIKEKPFYPVQFYEQIKSTSSCPVCKQAVDESCITNLWEEYQKQQEAQEGIVSYNHKINNQINALKDEIVILQKDIKRYEDNYNLFVNNRTNYKEKIMGEHNKQLLILTQTVRNIEGQIEIAKASLLKNKNLLTKPAKKMPPNEVSMPKIPRYGQEEIVKYKNYWQEREAFKTKLKYMEEKKLEAVANKDRVDIRLNALQNHIAEYKKIESAINELDTKVFEISKQTSDLNLGCDLSIADEEGVLTIVDNNGKYYNTFSTGEKVKADLLLANYFSKINTKYKFDFIFIDNLDLLSGFDMVKPALTVKQTFGVVVSKHFDKDLQILFQPDMAKYM